MNNRAKIERGQQAEYLLDHEAYRNVMDACLVHCQMLWANTGIEDSVSRETYFHQFKAVHAIGEMLKNFVEEGLRADREENGDKSSGH